MIESLAVVVALWIVTVGWMYQYIERRMDDLSKQVATHHIDACEMRLRIERLEFAMRTEVRKNR